MMAKAGKLFAILMVLGFVPVLSGCNESAPPPANRFVFTTHADPQRGEVVRIFDQQTGDYWIKWVGSDVTQDKVYSVWNYFPLKGTPETGLTEIKKPESLPVDAQETAVPQQAPATPQPPTTMPAKPQSETSSSVTSPAQKQAVPQRKQPVRTLRRRTVAQPKAQPATGTAPAQPAPEAPQQTAPPTENTAQ